MINFYKRIGVSRAFWDTVVRPRILLRDLFMCRECSSMDNLEIHSKSKEHINIDDLITLCKDCHKKEHPNYNVRNLI